ncbi:hypothetical protein SARC_17616, partial [Sphaeroforma arctica JP610]
MVALNFQTYDSAYQLNEGRFSDNGRCGYVLKPSAMSQKGFNPNAIKCKLESAIELSIE